MLHLAELTFLGRQDFPEFADIEFAVSEKDGRYYHEPTDTYFEEEHLLIIAEDV